MLRPINVTTDAQINEIQPTGRTETYWAGPDLLVVVRADNTKFFRTYTDKHVIGAWPRVSLELARTLARKYNTQQAKKRQYAALKLRRQAEKSEALQPEFDELPWS